MRITSMTTGVGLVIMSQDLLVRLTSYDCLGDDSKGLMICLQLATSAQSYSISVCTNCVSELSYVCRVGDKLLVP